MSEKRVVGYYWIKSGQMSGWEIARYSHGADGPCWWFTGWDIPSREEPAVVGEHLAEPRS